MSLSGSYADDFALVRILAAGQRDPNLVGVFDHVVVRQNVPCLSSTEPEPAPSPGVAA